MAKTFKRPHPQNLRQQVAVERKRRNILISVVLILAFLYAGTSLLFGRMGLIRYLQLSGTGKKLETEIRTIEKENKVLKAQVNALKGDPFYIEKHAREEYGLAKPDEFIFQFKDDEKN